MTDGKERPICEKTGKVCFSQRDAGNRTMKGRHRSGNYASKKQKPMRTYFCAFCGTYHLTHYRESNERYFSKKRYRPE